MKEEKWKWKEMENKEQMLLLLTQHHNLHMIQALLFLTSDAKVLVRKAR